jgi:hypothetical protein
MRFNTLRRAGLGLAAVLLLALGGTAPAAAATAISFEMTLYNPCAVVVGPPTGLASVSQLNASGTVLETLEAPLDGAGRGQVCFDDAFLTGMKVRGTTLGVTRTVTMPKLTLSTDRTTDVVRGTGPAAVSLQVSVRHWTTLKTHATTTFDRTTSSTGTWSKDLTSMLNLIGGDEVSISYEKGSDTFTRRGWVPRVTVTIGRSAVTANINPGTGGAVSLKTSTGTLRATAYMGAGAWNSSGPVENRFTSSGGNGVATRIGDKVSGPFQPSMSFTVPSITVAVDTGTDLVSGACQANRQVLVEVMNPAQQFFREATQCSAGGQYGADMTSLVNVQSGDRITVKLRLVAGDVVQRIKYVQ